MLQVMTPVHKVTFSKFCARSFDYDPDSATWWISKAFEVADGRVRLHPHSACTVLPLPHLCLELHARVDLPPRPHFAWSCGCSVTFSLHVAASLSASISCLLARSLTHTTNGRARALYFALVTSMM